jgi:hypothetical protein
LRTVFIEFPLCAIGLNGPWDARNPSRRRDFLGNDFVIERFGKRDRNPDAPGEINQMTFKTLSAAVTAIALAGALSACGNNQADQAAADANADANAMAADANAMATDSNMMASDANMATDTNAMSGNMDANAMGDANAMDSNAMSGDATP